MKSKCKGLYKDKLNGDNGRITKTIFVIFVAFSFIMPFTQGIMQANADLVVVDGDTDGSWEATFEDTSGVETWDNLELSEKGIKLVDYLYENFSQLDGDLPDSEKWHVLDDGYVLEISNNVLRTELNPPPSTWKREMIETKDDFGGNHTLTWTQNLYTVSSGMYYHFYILNGSDGSTIFGVNQMYTDQYQIYNMVASSGQQIGTAVSGWHDYKVTFNNGFIQFFFDGVMKYEYDFQVTSVKYQFGTNALDTWNRVYTDDISIQSNITIGNITSSEIILPNGKTWESLTINKSEYGIDNNISVSILDGVTYLPIFGFENLSDTNIDISSIDENTYPTIRLRACFSGNDNATPFLRGWKITWFDTIPPQPPTGLTVIDPFTGNSLFLSWNSNVESDVTTYILYFSTDNITFYMLSDVPADTLSFTHFGLTKGTTYYYKIAATDEVPNQSPDSIVITGVPDIDSDSDEIGNIVDDDDDGDTVPDVEDEFPLNPNEWFDTDSDGVGDNADNDDDGDGYDDTIDEFPLNDTEWNDLDSDGIGDNSDDDIDGDGIVNFEDDFPLNPNEWIDSDSDGMGDNADYDDDNDGYVDIIDEFPLDNNEWSDLDNDGIGDNSDDDKDGDGIANIQDIFPMDPTEWEDTDLDAIGNNKDLDIDGDGVFNHNDDFPFDYTEWNDMDSDGTGDNSDSDRDGDGIENVIDAFPDNSLEWEDTDSDGIGDNTDPDNDNDGYLDVIDLFPNNSTEWSDLDSDGKGDNSDPDKDGDGVENNLDDFPENFFEWNDNDLDGIGDNTDSDDDNDGYVDLNDEFPNNSTEWSDLDSDGIGDNSDVDIDGDGVGNNADVFPKIAHEWEDHDLDGIGDNSDLDDDNDKHPDTNDDYPYDSSRWQKPNEMIPLLYILIIIGIIVLAVMFFIVAKIGKLQKAINIRPLEEPFFEPQNEGVNMKEDIKGQPQMEPEFEELEDEIATPEFEVESDDLDLPPPPPPPE
jgi:hypothetical protein